MKKIMLLILIIIPTIIPTNATTLEELRNQNITLEEQRQENLNKLKQQEMTMNDIINQITNVSDESDKVIAQQNQIKTQIQELENEIKKCQERIIILEDKAASSLVFLQEVDDANYLIEELFGDNNNQNNSVQTMNITNQIVSSGLDAIDETILLEEQIKQEEEKIQIKNIELENKKQELEAKEQELEILKNKGLNEQKQIKTSFNSETAQIIANNALAELMVQAGCQEGDVYGVDCGILESASGFTRPVSYGIVTCEYGDGCYPGHTGIDIAQPQLGTNDNKGYAGPVYATAPGQVLKAGYFDEKGGNMVMIVHNIDGKQIISSYAHLNSINVRNGQYVDTSTQIGVMGTTGTASSGVHLHFEISLGQYGHYAGGTFVNPRQYVNFPPTWVRFNSR